MRGLFVNRQPELERLERWWRSDGLAAVVWGRRRVGKTALLQQFAKDKPTVFHTGAGRGVLDELAFLARQVRSLDDPGLRDLDARPYTDWDDALEDLAARAHHRRVLLVLDEFPELVSSAPDLPGRMRAFLDRAHGHTKLRVLLCGSAVRHMESLQDHREPLFGRFDESLLIHPFAPHEAAVMLKRLVPADRALVYGIVGGMPLYLSWWDTAATVTTNLRRLVTEPGARLLTEGDLVMRTDLDGGDYAHLVLHAIANGRTQYGEIRDYIRTEPTRTLERLTQLRLIERLQPVGEPSSNRRRIYRITEPFLRFHLGVAARYRNEIERGLGSSIAPVLRSAIDEHMGDVWEEAFRQHLRYLAASGQLPVTEQVVAIGPWWGAGGNEIDALALAGRSGTPVLAGEAKWARSVDANRLVHGLRSKMQTGLRLDPEHLTYAVCARLRLRNLPPGTLALTAADLFALR